MRIIGSSNSGRYPSSLYCGSVESKQVAILFNRAMGKPLFWRSTATIILGWPQIRA
jgi:hypothetical protein